MNDIEPVAPYPEQTVSLRAAFLARLVMGMVLLLLATGIVWAGLQAIQQKSWDLPWQSGGGVILAPVHFLNWSNSGVDSYRGTDAVRVGVGLSASGIMLTIWGLALLWSAANLAISRKLPDTVIRGFVPKSLAVLSLVCLAAATISFFPPWHFGISASATAFYAEWLSIGVLLAVPATRRKTRQWGLPTVIVAAILTDLFSTGACVGISLGIFFGVGIACHLLMLFSKGGQQRRA
jgi:hypothetical protein